MKTLIGFLATGMLAICLANAVYAGCGGCTGCGGVSDKNDSCSGVCSGGYTCFNSCGCNTNGGGKGAPCGCYS